MMPNSAGSPVLHHARRTRPHLDGQYAAFGKVIEGIEVVDQIAATPTDRSDRPKTEQRMLRVTVEE